MNQHEYVKSSPHFFRLIKGSFLIALLALLLAAFVIPAPLQEPADFARVPNPSKSAWFLLWMQELVAYSNYLVYLIVVLGLFFAALPWLPGIQPAKRARWFPPEQRLVSWFTVFTFSAIIVLTVIAMGFRGENWALVWPF